LRKARSGVGINEGAVHGVEKFGIRRGVFEIALDDLYA
jgi:hypothetical protein